MPWHTAVWVPEDDRAFATRLARDCARNPVAVERLTYDRTTKAVTYRSDTSDGPTAGTETVDPLEFLARVLVHTPDKGHVTTRYDGWSANRPRGMRCTAEPSAAAVPPAIVPAPRLAPSEATRRWATLLQPIVEVDPLACPACLGVMRIVACITTRRRSTRSSRTAAPARRRPTRAARGVPPRPADRLDRASRDDPPQPIGLTTSHPDAPITRGDVR